MATLPPAQPLFEDDNTAMSRVSPGLVHKLEQSVADHGELVEEGIDPAIAQALARLTVEAEPPLPPPADPVPEISPEPAPRPAARPWWRWGAGVVMTLSLLGNVLCGLALRTSRLAAAPAPGGARTVVAAVATQSGSPAAEAEPLAPCLRNSTQTITGAARDRLLHGAIAAYEAGRRSEALAGFRQYVSEACDSATIEAVLILEREHERQLPPPDAEAVNTP